MNEMRKIKCQCGKTIAATNGKYNEVKLQSGKFINITFPVGCVKCPSCDKIYYLDQFGNAKITTDMVTFN